MRTLFDWWLFFAPNDVKMSEVRKQKIEKMEYAINLASKNIRIGYANWVLAPF